MAYSSHRARFEAELARAHRALFYATQAAVEMQSQGDVEDCQQLLLEVTRLTEASLRDKRRRGSSSPT